jgi:hypothetical protein
MEPKLLIIAGLALAISAPLASAQEWGDRREYMHELRRDCEDGDDRACERLRHMRHEEREAQEREERRRDEDREERGRAAPPLAVDTKTAVCLAIENNYNNCLRQQHDGCPAWVVELKANHCF